MRVVLSPGAEMLAGGIEAAGALAGAEGTVAVLSQLGVRNVRRPLSRAEVQVVRGALLGVARTDGSLPRSSVATDEELLIGYVCSGTASPTGWATGVRSVVVADHVNLTWDSPLTGPNDEGFGLRFPVIAGVYRPEAASITFGGGSPVGVVAGVCDDRRLTAFESEVVVQHGMPAVSSELTAVSIVAAHMGLRVVAVVVVDGVCEMPPGAGGSDGPSNGLERSG